MISTMLDVKVDRAEPTPLHDQVAGEIRRAIADGEALPASGFRPARDIGRRARVNTNTVLRALRLRATEVCLSSAEAAASTSRARRSAARSCQSSELIQFARQRGYRPDELVK